MNRSTLIKFAQFFIIVLVGVGADQWSKHYAEDRLASSRLGHDVVLPVTEADDGETVEEFLAGELTWSSPEEVERLAKRWVRDGDGQRMRPEDKVTPGETVHVLNRDVTVVEGYFDFQYTRNPGAAFGFLADSQSEYRRHFFVVISLIAFLIILYIMYGVALGQQILIWGLSLIAAGALGNFIDRVRFGYVIDFILWKYTNEYRWPTFNVADALICVGVGLMLIEIIRDTMRERREAQLAAEGCGDAVEEEGA